MIPIVNGVLTLMLIIVFIGIWGWAWSSRNKASFEKMAYLPLEENDNVDGESDVK